MLIDATIQVAIIGGVAGLVTGVIGSLIAPWANWLIEKRKQKLAYRRELVAKWRKMVEEVNLFSSREELTHKQTREMLVKHVDYYSLHPHLQEKVLKKHNKVIDKIKTPDYKVFGTYTILTFLVDQIAEIEKKWKLV
jgi:hypothetical protein